MNRDHASFFSGVGGLDLGLERAAWRTVSFSEIDPYACAVLARHWPEVTNLGDIADLVRAGARGRRAGQGAARDWRRATLWSGGFPCQDLSVAGRRRGLAGERSGLAFAFLDLVERHRPPAVLLENVPGLLSSHRGRDMAVLLGRLVELGYGVAYRVLDAQHFGVPQRRRRVFILGLRSDSDDADGHRAAERAAAVLGIGTRCRRHPPAGTEAGPGPAAGAGGGVDHALTTRPRGRLDPDGEDYVIGPSPDPGRARAADGLAGRLDDRVRVVGSLTGTKASGGWRVGADEAAAGQLVVSIPARTLERDGTVTERFVARDVSDTLHGPTGKEPLVAGTFSQDADPLLPLGLDSHRYRVTGNGVVAPVAEWIGRRLMRDLHGTAAPSAEQGGPA